LGNRVVPALLVALLVLVHAQLWFGRGSIASVAILQQQLDAQKAANLKAQQANERLTSEVRDLKEGVEIVEEKARMELGMVKPNEIYVQIAK
jgi:cell division protein FtsB